MDANGTRFHLFFGRADWAKWIGVINKPPDKEELHMLGDAWKSDELKHAIGLNWNKERGELTLDPRLFNFAPNGSAPSIENRRGAARDHFGNWYWIDETSLRIRVLSSGSRTATDFWRLPEKCACPPRSSSGNFQSLNEPAPETPIKLSGLAVTENHYLVVGTIAPAGLLIFDLYSGGEPRQILWPNTVDFEPFDMAARPGGGVWILDREHKSYWALDRNFNVIGDDPGTLLSPEKTDDFQPVDGSSLRQTAARNFPGSFSLLQSPIVAINPIAIEALPDETVLILDYDPTQSFSRIHRYRYATRLPDEISTDAILGNIEKEDQASFKLIGYDIAFVPEHTERGRKVPDSLYVVGADGNQTYAFTVCLRAGQIELQPRTEYFPMRLFGGKALVGTDSGAYYDFAEDWIPLVQQRRPRYVADATLMTEPLDGRDPDCVWHRLMLDACIPPETKVEVWSRAANDKKSLEFTHWQSEPGLYLRASGSEIPFLRSKRNGSTSSTKIGDGTWELLFQRARGRYMQLKLRLSGDERSTPRLSALRAYYPRFSYLTNYLPSVYREDDQSASFLDRFLANLEGVYTALEDRIASAQILFDVRSAPKEVLDWLASWFDVALDPSWDEAKRRMFIAHAMDFFQYRGTIRGLTIALHLALDPCADETIFTGSKSREEIRIIEKYLTRKMPAVALGDPTQATGLRTVAVTPTWFPAQGRSNLMQRYSSSFTDPAGGPVQQYSLIAPEDATKAAQWSQFSQTTLGFVPSIYAREQNSWQGFLRNRHGQIAKLNSAHQTNWLDFVNVPLPRDLPQVAAARTDWIDFITAPTSLAERRLWQDFLARRYRRVGALNGAYGTAWTGFEVVALPAELPQDGVPLNDWFQFETVVLRMHSTAHRFTVLLPVPASLAFKPEEHQTRLALAQRIVDLEKPAHTVFDVRFYWAMFRIGEARLQLDTVIDQGSRAPQLLPGLILGEGFVGTSYLSTPAMEAAPDRHVLGREALGITPR